MKCLNPSFTFFNTLLIVPLKKKRSMKLFYLILFFPFLAAAQISVDVNDFADGGDTVRLSITTNPGIDFATTGANTNWNFSDLSAESQELLE